MNGDHPVRCAERGFSDSILLDLMMPGKNGFDACEAVKRIGNEMTEDKKRKKRQRPRTASEKAAREDAEIAQRRYRDLAEGIDHGIVWEANESLHFCMVSKRAERLTGFSVEQWCSEPAFWIHHVYPEDQEEVRSAFQKALNGEDQTSEHRFITADGRVIWFHTGIHVAHEDGAVIYRGLSVEITHLKETEQKLREKTREAEESNKIKSYFLSVASHEMRNALNAIVGYAQLLYDEKTKPDKLKETYQRILRNGKELVDLMNRILDVNKIEAGRMHLQVHLNEISPLGILKEVIEDLRLIWEEKGLDVELVGEPEEPYVRSDPGKLRQIFSNLITNAIKFTDEGKITVRVVHHCHDRKICVEIDDTGPGIEEEDLPNLFTPYYQKDPSGAKLGAGLGLSISKKLVEFLKGSIDVQSRPGEGATFRITLPYDFTAPESSEG